MYITANNIRIYYEVIGKGSPVILLHGNGENHEIFNELAAALADRYTVYMPDTRGHGLSENVYEYHYDDMVNDLIGFVKALNLEKPQVFGFSDGGIVALLAGIKCSDLFGRLIVAGANMKPDDIKAEALKEMVNDYRLTADPLIYLMLTEPDIKPQDLQKISVPVMVVAGEHDLIKEVATKRIALLISDAQLRIIKGHDHSSYIVHSDYLKDFI